MHMNKATYILRSSLKRTKWLRSGNGLDHQITVTADSRSQSQDKLSAHNSR